MDVEQRTQTYLDSKTGYDGEKTQFNDRTLQNSEEPRLKLDVANRNTSTNEPSIQDVTEEYDEGYEGDAETIYPDSYEDARASDNESTTTTQAEGDVGNHESLIRGLRRLRCGPIRIGSSASHARNFSEGSSGVKRSHSEESLTDFEDEIPHDGETSTPERKRARTGVTESPIAFNVTTSMLPRSPDAMEIDSHLPSNHESAKRASLDQAAASADRSMNSEG